MEENNKVVIFEKKELVLISLLVVVLIATSFTIGVKMGKKISLDAAGVSRRTRKLLSSNQPLKKMQKKLFHRKLS